MDSVTFLAASVLQLFELKMYVYVCMYVCLSVYYQCIFIPAEAGKFSLHHRVQTGSGAHPASYPMGTRDSFPGSKVAGA
jgi:hypothetical protein